MTNRSPIHLAVLWFAFVTPLGAEELITPRERAAHLLSASLQLKWAAWMKRYPRIPALDIVPCGDSCYRVNGVRYPLAKPGAALDRLPDVRVIGLVRDAGRPTLLLQTRKEDPTYLWANYQIAERRLKFIGYDKVEKDLPGEDFGMNLEDHPLEDEQTEIARFLTTRSASNLNILRDEFAVRLGCDPDYVRQAQTTLETLAPRLPDRPGPRGRLAELRALINFYRQGFIPGSDRTAASYCEPKRSKMWRDYLLELRVLTEYAISYVDASEFAP